MNATTLRPLAAIESCRDLSEKHDWADASAEVELPAGTLLDGRFAIGSPISCGGMATIYAAEDMLDGARKVAVKVPFARFGRDPGYVARFLREEAIGLKLHHPFLLQFVPITTPKSRQYLVTEYLAGSTLARVLHHHAPLPERDALTIASLICTALHYLHEQNFLHRDIKTDNIMLCCDQTIRLMDFGLIAPVAGKFDVLANKTPVFGTPQYMAPEQVTRSRCGPPTDIYSLGVVLYEMLTGQLPFQHADPWVIAQSRVAGDPPAPRQLNPAISPAVEEIVLHALRRKPAERYPSAAAMQAELDAPEKVSVTGLCHRLRPPRRVLSLEQAQLRSGIILSVIFILILVGGFFALLHLLPRH